MERSALHAGADVRVRDAAVVDADVRLRAIRGAGVVGIPALVDTRGE
jgi:hypothetical protein